MKKLPPIGWRACVQKVGSRLCKNKVVDYAYVYENEKRTEIAFCRFHAKKYIKDVPNYVTSKDFIE